LRKPLALFILDPCLPAGRLRFAQDDSKAKFVFRLAYAVILKNFK